MYALARTHEYSQLLIPDGRVTADGLDGLLASTDCKVWVYAEDDSRGPLIRESTQMRTCALPSLEWILSDSEHKVYPYNKTYEQAAHDEIFIVHTSGTTGVPRPIIHTNGFWCAMTAVQGLSRRHWPRGIAHDGWIGRTGLNCCAPQWVAGIHAMIMAPAFMDCPCIMLPPDVLSPSPALFKKLMTLNYIDGIRGPPQTIVTLYEDPETRAMLKSLKYLVYLGAQLDRSIGDDLCQHVRLTPLIGSTETGDQLSLKPRDRKLWYTHDFVPESGSKLVRIEPSGHDAKELYELVHYRSENGEANMFQPAFWNPAFKDLNCIETKELYAPVLDSDGRTRWVFAARKDDLTKLSWLAKFHAEDIEGRIQQHGDVKSVHVGGEGRPAPYVIIETKEGVLGRINEEQLLEELYRTVVVKTNDVDIQEIRIPKETIFIATKEKPFRRNLKQVVVRKEVEEDYREEIEQAYLRLEGVKSTTQASK
jgi:acyl-coenzyme A synthetase/AMP-(fatty) acid ligase